MNSLLLLQRRIGYFFKDESLLEQALSHSSFANESGFPHKHNERLEFLGDAVLELCVSLELFHRFPYAREGELTTLRSKLVSETALARIAADMGIDQAIRLGAGDEKQGGRKRPSILSDALEALIAAIFEDGGLIKVQEIINNIFADHWPDDCNFKPAKDYKCRLQEIMQKKFKELPIYTLENSEGPEHAKIFEVCLRLPDGQTYFGKNTSCKKAEQDAAALALKDLSNS